MSYCIDHLSEDCICKTAILQRMDDACTTLHIAAHTITIERKKVTDLLKCLQELITTCPADPDTTEDFLKANQKAAELISQLLKPKA